MEYRATVAGRIGTLGAGALSGHLHLTARDKTH